MWKLTNAEETLPFALLGLTAVTGLVDAVSFLSLGHVFTANMTGNVVFLGFAIPGVPEVSAARSLIALLAFVVGAIVGGRVLAKARADAIQAAVILFGLEISLIAAAMFSAIGYRGAPAPASIPLYLIIICGGNGSEKCGRSKARHLTTTVLTMTITGFAADSSLAGGSNPRWQKDSMLS